MASQRQSSNLDWQKERIVDASYIADKLGVAPKTIRNMARSNPNALPPRVSVPGFPGRLGWLESDVQGWLERNVKRIQPPKRKRKGRPTIAEKMRGEVSADTTDSFTHSPS